MASGSFSESETEKFPSLSLVSPVSAMALCVFTLKFINF